MYHNYWFSLLRNSAVLDFRVYSNLLCLPSRVHSQDMIINVQRLLLPSSLSRQSCQLLPVTCTIGMKLATSQPVICGLKRIRWSWSCGQGFHCLVDGKLGSTWATMFLAMSTCTTLVSGYLLDNQTFTFTYNIYLKIHLYLGPKLWNKLPGEIRTRTITEQF